MEKTEFRWVSKEEMDRMNRNENLKSFLIVGVIVVVVLGAGLLLMLLLNSGGA